MSVHSGTYGETMHPGEGPWAEANRLYVAAAGLDRLLLEPSAKRSGHAAAKHAGAGDPGGSAVCVFDVGLGAAANAIAALECRRGLLRKGRAVRPLHLISFEADVQGAHFACEQAQALGYPRGWEEALRALIETGTALPEEGVRWELRLGDFTQLIHEEPARADVIFFDPFSPRSNPAMWSLPTLEGLHACRPRAGGSVLVTYSTAFAVRAGLLLAGFSVGEGPRANPQSYRGRGSTVAATWLSALSEPLGGSWLARWRKERDPWPPGTPPEQRRALREALLAHPQWGADPPTAAESSEKPARTTYRRRRPGRKR